MPPFTTRSRTRPIVVIQSEHHSDSSTGNTDLLRYVQAVMRSYIEVKEARGRSKQEIAWKLEILEREVSIILSIRYSLRNLTIVLAARIRQLIHGDPGRKASTTLESI